MSTDEQHELAVQEQPTESPRSDIAILISQAIAVNLDIDKLTKLLEQQHIEEDRQAERAFLKAKAMFQRDCPEVPHDQKGQTPSGIAWTYSTLGLIEKTVKPHCAKHWLSYHWIEREGRQVCILAHRDGHREESSFTLSMEGQRGGLSKMTRQQQEGATDTYSRGRTLTAVLGIGTAQKDLGGAEPAENDKNEDVLARTATTAEYEALKAGWWGFARPAGIMAVERADFDSLERPELAELFMAWVCRSIDGLDGFIKRDRPHSFFTARQIVDLWAIINKDKEDKVDASSDEEGKRMDSD